MTNRKISSIPIEVFRNLIRTHSWHFKHLDGLRKPSHEFDPDSPLPEQLLYQENNQNNTNNDNNNNNEDQKNIEDFEVDMNILLLMLWHTYKHCHNSPLCSAQFSNPHLSSDPYIWTEKWRDKFDVPIDIPLVDVSWCSNYPEIMDSITKLIGGCACCGITYNQIDNGNRIPREMFIQFFLVAILKENSEFFDLSSISSIGEVKQSQQQQLQSQQLQLHSQQSQQGLSQQIENSFISNSNITKISSSWISQGGGIPEFSQMDGTNSIDISPSRLPSVNVRRKSRRCAAVTDIIQSR